MGWTNLLSPVSKWEGTLTEAEKEPPNHESHAATSSAPGSHNPHSAKLASLPLAISLSHPQGAMRSPEGLPQHVTVPGLVANNAIALLTEMFQMLRTWRCGKWATRCTRQSPLFFAPPNALR